MTTTRTYQPALVAGFALALAMLVAAAVLDWRQNRRVEETQTLVARTHEVQSASARLLSLVQDIETGERGFIVTGEPAYLEPFEDALNTVGEQERRLEQLVVSDEQKANLRVMKSLTASWARTVTSDG